MKRLGNTRCRICQVYILLFMTMLLSIINTEKARSEKTLLKIGVLAVRGREQCLKSWAPTAEYLSGQVGRTFIIIPLSHDQIYPVVQRGEVDFILANSAFYVGLEYWYHTSRIATLKERRGNEVYTRYGGVIFFRRDRKDIHTLRDLKGKSFMGVDSSSLGGWLMAWRELKEIGIEPYRDFKELSFKDTHDKVVYAVRDRLIDAGTVRTNTLETLSAEGKINLADYHVFPRLHDREIKTHYLCTTREYPGWPMARVRHTHEGLAENVALALLQMPLDSAPAIAADCGGWTIPLNYQPVHDCLKVLKTGPYKDLGKITFKDVMLNYGYWIIFACALFCILATFTGMILNLNRRIKTSNVRLKVEIDLRKQRDLELEQAKDLAEAAARAKSDFLANMSHEIRTPMNGVIAATDLALGEDVPPKIQQYLNIIQNSAYSLLGIINDILDFSKIEAGKFQLIERMFRLNEVFDQVMELFVNKAAEKGIEMLLDIEPGTPHGLRGDPLRLQQILTNLISNAIKFTDSGGVILVHVKVDRKTVIDPAGQDVVLAFAVKDTGTGIAPEYINLLFEPFTQADTSSTRKHEGTGLGLSICKQLVTMMGGDIGVESELGAGSTFFFTVRLSRSSNKPVSRLVLPPDIQGLNVLVVDDLADSRLIMDKMLGSLGFRVETLDSGDKALTRLKESMGEPDPIDLVIMDWKMPSMDGIEASRKIRQELKLELPIIMMTAFGREEQRMEAEKTGINGFLHKPIYPSTLFDAIMDGFGKEGVREGGRKQQFTTRASIYRKPLKGVSILVAEDNPTNQQVARAILEGAGIKVTLANNGQEAVDALKNDVFDAVLMDIQMPRMNGYDATRLIRELPGGGSIPIVAMTAHAMKGDEEKCLEAGMDGYISKPVNQDRLFQTLWRLLRTRKSSIKNSRPEEQEEDDEHVKPEIKPGETRENHAPITSERSLENTGILPALLPGINIQKIRETMNIDDPTLTLILAGFLADNQNTIQKLRKAATGQAPDSLRYLAHSLKGSSANIGAGELSIAARDLEEACSRDIPLDTNSDVLKALIFGIETELNQVLASIQSLEKVLPGDKASGDKTPDYEADPPASAGTAMEFDRLVDQLLQAIERSDPEQIMKTMPPVTQQAALRKNIDPGGIKILEEHIKRYDYDQALETIQKFFKT